MITYKLFAKEDSSCSSYVKFQYCKRSMWSIEGPQNQKKETVLMGPPPNGGFLKVQYLYLIIRFRFPGLILQYPFPLHCLQGAQDNVAHLFQ